VREGTTVTFWEYLWSEDILAHQIPVLYSFAKSTSTSVQEILLAYDLDSLFHLPLSLPASNELFDLQQLLVTIPYNGNESDTWIYIWGNHLFTSRRYYNLVYQYLQVSPVFKMMWKSKCTQRIKFFAWLLLVDRLNTRVMLQRRHFQVQPNSHCVMCTSAVEEDIEHLFFSCPFAGSCWNKLGVLWLSAVNVQDRIVHAARNSNIPLFIEVFLIATWEIWNLRNAKIFDNGRPTLRLWLNNFKQQAQLQLLRVREIDTPSFVQWLDTIT